MSEDFVFSAVRNCELREEKFLLLGIGRSTFRIDASPGSQFSKQGFCYLTFDLEARKPFAGLPGELKISWQDVPIAHLEIGAFGRQSLRIPIKSFKTPSTFNFELKFQAGEELYKSDFDDFAPQHAADASNFHVETNADELGPRSLLIPAARGLSVELGLIDDYLTTEKYAAIMQAILGALAEGKGFSLIRLGDGEGRVLGYPDHFTDQEVLLQLLHYQFGPESMQLVKLAAQDAWIAASMEFLRGMLIKSIKNADIVGLPPNTHFPADGDMFGLLGYACAMIYGLSISKNLPKRVMWARMYFSWERRNVCFSVTFCGSRARYFWSVHGILRKNWAPHLDEMIVNGSECQATIPGEIEAAWGNIPICSDLWKVASRRRAAWKAVCPWLAQACLANTIAT